MSHSVTLNSKVAGPIMRDLAIHLHDNFNTDGDDNLINTSVALIALGLVIAEDVGAESELQFLTAAQAMKVSFRKYLDNAIDQFEKDEEEND